MNFDFHIHSDYSYDSDSKIEDIVKEAKKKGLNGIAITDHETIKGALEAININHDPEFQIIIGSEIKTEYGDIIGLFLKDEISSRNFIEVIHEIKNQDGIVVLPHPYRGTKIQNIINNELLEHIDLIETFNSRTGRYDNFYAEELAQKYNKPTIGGSDAHCLSEIGLVSIKCDLDTDLKEQLLDNKCQIKKTNLSYSYQIAHSRYIKEKKKNKTISALKERLKEQFLYFFRVEQDFFIPEVIPNDKLQNKLDQHIKYYNSWIWRYQHRQRIDNVISLLPSFNVNNNSKVLEVGCGRGPYTNILANLSSSVCAIEYSTREIKEAKKYIEQSGLIDNVTLIIADAQFLPFKNDTFNFVLCSEVLEHLNQPKTGVSEIYRVLIPGNKALISMPNLISYFWMKNRIQVEIKNKIFRKKIPIDPHVSYPYWRIINLIKTSNFKIKVLNGTHLFSGGLIFGYLIQNHPMCVKYLNKLEKKFKKGFLFSFFFVKIEK
ncbi:methyltransferase domain-containing protein [Methanomicrobium antiquum]|uniref:Methyltransferase domain-containing protein n=1 Tax=Methanomicrobium antiquum TaxID=487686 RepID=A0AAF0JNH0_9EURY|nr:methyltransferase domain-containing protein [Methanomicrobium antiquum]WFN37406.1 methyltransferase domain-containing protein [Methanomicrobium antiquum]